MSTTPQPSLRPRPASPPAHAACADSSRAQVHVGGWVRRPLALGMRALAEFGPSVLVPAFAVVCTFDGPHGAARPLRGVPLQRLVEAAQPAFAQRTDFKRVALVAESAEGYRALFSWSEVFNSPAGAGVIVAWDADDAPLPPPAGPFALASLHDVATGPRFVQRLRSVELHKLW